MNEVIPPGQPGVVPHWTWSTKSGVGTAASTQSQVWFTLSHGIINEVYCPTLDSANIRDLGFVVSDGQDFFSEEKRDTQHDNAPLAQGVPGYRLTNHCLEGRYRLTKTVITDPQRDVLIQQVQFEVLKGSLSDYKLYALLSPHLANQGYGNYGWVGDYKGVPMLFARRGGRTLALACSTPFKAMSCGYVGVSDGWQDIKANKQLTQLYTHAPDGNIALTGEIDLTSCDGSFILALSFGTTPEEAGQRARAALLDNFKSVVEQYIHQWQVFQQRCLPLENPNKAGFDLYRSSTAVLKTHEAKNFTGGMIASLSIPWGEVKGDNDLGGYHLVWPRDLVESAGGLMAAGDILSVRQTVFYLMCTQEADGHWVQNMWLDGRPYWTGLQMDETALFILVADSLRRMNELHELNIWPSVLKAASFVVCNGPLTQEDRWEENGGYTPFTLAIEIAGLLAAAEFAQIAGKEETANYLCQTADIWNDNIERWTYVTGTEIARQVGVEGYYVCITPPEDAEAASASMGTIPIRNRLADQTNHPAASIVSPDALALVRFGLRRANDPRILNTVKVIDSLLKTETTTGPVWHRYNEDGYGEHPDGSPFDGTGIGRGWPLLAGERAHYELAAGNEAEARRLLEVITNQASSGGLISEQVWDAPDIPEKELFNGHPSHSARPLVWAHAEYIKLLRSLKDGKIFDLPPFPVQRYQVEGITSVFTIWRFNHQPLTIPVSKTLRVEVLAPAIVHWTSDNWRTAADIETQDSGLGLYYADLPVKARTATTRIIFTFCWSEVNHWEGRNFEVEVKQLK